MSEPVPELDPPWGLAGDGTWDMDGEGPCRTWPLVENCLTCMPLDPILMDAQQRHAVEAATEILWRLTAGRYGMCRELLRPCSLGCPTVPQDRFGRGMRPQITDGKWINIGCGCAPGPNRDSCGCGTGPDRLDLPGPVVWDRPGSVSLDREADRYELVVFVDGEELDEGVDFTLYPKGKLYRAQPHTWPTCQDLMADFDAPGAFSVLYWRGIRVPIGGRRAVTTLACEIYKKCVGDSSCALPERVTSITRDGMSFTMIDPMRFLDQGRTGLADVDLWLSTVNPSGALQPSVVWSPDLVDHRPQARGQQPWMPPYPRM